MPFTFNKVNNAPDIASNNRFQVMFPSIAGLGDMSILSMLTHAITLPQKAIGHIQIRVFDQSIGFRGGRTFDNQMTITFYENVAGQGLTIINQWMDLVRDVNGNGGKKATYSGEGELDIFDTVGDTIYEIPLKGMFPISHEFPSLDEGGSAPMEFTVTFNVDSVEIPR